MTDFVVAFGLVFVIEGLLLAAFPGGAKRTMANVMELHDGTLRISGIIAAAVGLVIVWLIRGWHG